MKEIKKGIIQEMKKVKITPMRVIVGIVAIIILMNIRGSCAEGFGRNLLRIKGFGPEKSEGPISTQPYPKPKPINCKKKEKKMKRLLKKYEKAKINWENCENLDNNWNLNPRNPI